MKCWDIVLRNSAIKSNHRPWALGDAYGASVGTEKNTLLYDLHKGSRPAIASHTAHSALLRARDGRRENHRTLTVLLSSNDMRRLPPG